MGLDKNSDGCVEKNEWLVYADEHFPDRRQYDPDNILDGPMWLDLAAGEDCMRHGRLEEFCDEHFAEIKHETPGCITRS